MVKILEDFADIFMQPQKYLSAKIFAQISESMELELILENLSTKISI